MNFIMKRREGADRTEPDLWIHLNGERDGEKSGVGYWMVGLLEPEAGYSLGG